MSNILVTGSSSGLGKSAQERFNSRGLTRQNSKEELERMKQEGVDIIIHCAFNSGKRVTSANLYDYLNDNILLTQDLTKIPHRKFVLISTIGVYPPSNKIHHEEEVIMLNDVKGIYGMSKLMSESIVRNNCSSPLILRCSSLLGKSMRENNLTHLLYDEKCQLTLTGDSSLNYTLHSDVLDFIEFALQKNLSGTYNTVSNDNITLSEIADLFGRRVNFGEYRYDAGLLSNERIKGVFPKFNKSSSKVIQEFLQQTRL